MISGDFLKEGHGHGREKAAIYATLETSRSLPKEDQSAKISFPKEMI